MTDYEQRFLGPVLAVTRTGVTKPVHLRYLTRFEDIIHIGRKPPTKRLKIKSSPTITYHVDPPITGLPMVILLLLFLGMKQILNKFMYMYFV